MNTDPFAVLDNLEATTEDRGLSLALVEKARTWLTAFHAECDATWCNPDVTRVLNANGEIAFCWEREQGFLWLVITEHSATSIKCADPSEEVEHGLAETPEERAALWAWMIGGEEA